MRVVRPHAPGLQCSRHWLTSTGLGVLFGKLQQGVQENQQILTVARLRADAEDVYGTSLASITPSTERVGGGLSRDEGASVRKVSAGTAGLRPPRLILE